MNLYRIYRTDEIGYDEYDSAVVAAEMEQEAICLDPSQNYLFHDGSWWLQLRDGTESEIDFQISSWVHPDEVRFELLGTAKPGTKRGVILASFNAG